MSKRELEDSVDCGSNTPPKAKKKKYMCTFNASWTLKYPCIVKSDRGDNSAFCTLCMSHFGVSAGGKNDVERHLTCKAHQSKVKSTKSTPSLKTIFPTVEDPFTKKVTNAEVLFATFIAEHDLAFNIADHFTKLVPRMFPDSKIAEKFACSRQKTANVINNALAPVLRKDITELCKREKFSILMDESNDKGCDKSVAILVCVHDSTVHRVVTGFLAMPVCNIGTAENLFSQLQEVMTDREIPWNNVVGYMSDNANVMVGEHNSVLSRVREKQPAVYDLGCVCHVINTCLSYALKKLPCSVEDLLIGVFYYFQHSSKRKEEYKEFVDFMDIADPGKILKHCPTRWLSLQNCVRRTLTHWPALQSYFSSQPDVERKGSRVQKCAQMLQDEFLHLIYLFLDFILEPIMKFNTEFQANEAMVGYLHSEMKTTLKRVMSKFVKMDVITSAPDITKVEYMSVENQHDNSNIAVGRAARLYMENNTDLPQETLDKFFQYVAREAFLHFI